MLKRVLAVATCAVAFSGAVSAVPAAAAAKPAVIVDYGVTPAKVKVKPATFRPYKDVEFTSVHWTKLTATTGAATAVQRVNTCKPSCADGNYKSDKVTLTFSKVRSTPRHQKVFAQVKVTVTRTHKSTTLALPTRGEWE
ncbi:hypothetical protein [Actinoplanes sp. TFC3]|uniref:hypothetical protein n=1 Tax=Actinoplanes sp. TFC3 TaxID=1710355 RepID=UPI00082BD142|nr:hypothetical protein [Actinoplanes sp. TFC3]